jgi:hypothetical protein
MNKISHIPKKLNDELNQDADYNLCLMFGWFGHECEGRISRDHSMKFNGASVQKKWAINPVCILAHGIEGYKDSSYKKEIREWISLCRATDKDILEMTNETELNSLSKAAAFIQRKKYLINKYGLWSIKYPTPSEILQPQEPKSSKKNWYLISDEDTAMINKIRAFYTSMGINYLPRETIKNAIENEYLQIKDRLLEEDKDLFTKLGFDK